MRNRVNQVNPLNLGSGQKLKKENQLYKFYQAYRLNPFNKGFKAVKDGSGIRKNFMTCIVE